MTNLQIEICPTMTKALYQIPAPDASREAKLPNHIDYLFKLNKDHFDLSGITRSCESEFGIVHQEMMGTTDITGTIVTFVHSTPANWRPQNFHVANPAISAIPVISVAKRM